MGVNGQVRVNGLLSTATSPLWLREPLTCPHLREPLTFTLWASCILPASPFASAAPQGKRSRTGRACPASRMSSHLQDPKPRHTEAGTSKTSSFLTPAATVLLQKLGRRAQPQLSTSEVRSAPRSSRNRLPPARPSLVLRSQHPGPPPASTSSQGRRPETTTQRKGYLSRQEGRAPLTALLGPAPCHADSGVPARHLAEMGTNSPESGEGDGETGWGTAAARGLLARIWAGRPHVTF